MENDVTIGKVMERMPSVFLPEKAQGVVAVIQFHFTGEGAGDWVLKIADGACEVAPGSTEAPKLTITSAASDYVEIALGKLEAMSAFAAGKIKLQGDLALAMKLMGFFRRS